MKFRPSFWGLILTCCLFIASVGSSSAQSPEEFLMSADEILGTANMLELQNRQMIGTFETDKGVGNLTLTQTPDGKFRETWDFGGYTLDIGFDGDQLWMKETPGTYSPKIDPTFQIDRFWFSNMINLVGLHSQKNKGIEIQPIGLSEVEGLPTFTVRAVTKTGDFVDYAIDTENMQIKRTQAVLINGSNEMMLAITYRNYEEINGALISTEWIMQRNGDATNHIIFKQVNDNVEIPDYYFMNPVKKAEQIELENQR
ncbi:hypothetical protein [Pontibacter sp. G13]|uniref:hypothetical protein n=1 Tax=Pontibacter sp. G13 TaxID=3074898 RepID=UPI00288C40CB|nr:hypothetical protein [Pontibacter sp. G13]WNJ18546.1 hypothetical protein RJD25_27135 [Pontibacter sp. G13]